MCHTDWKYRVVRFIDVMETAKYFQYQPNIMYFSLEMRKCDMSPKQLIRI